MATDTRLYATKIAGVFFHDAAPLFAKCRRIGRFSLSHARRVLCMSPTVTLSLVTISISSTKSESKPFSPNSILASVRDERERPSFFASSSSVKLFCIRHSLRFMATFMSISDIYSQDIFCPIWKFTLCRIRS